MLTSAHVILHDSVHHTSPQNPSTHPLQALHLSSTVMLRAMDQDAYEEWLGALQSAVYGASVGGT